MTAIKSTVYDLILEDQLNQKQTPPPTSESMALELKKIFPWKDSTVGSIELKELLAYADENGDGRVSLGEVYAWV